MLIKICGVTSLDDALAALDAGADVLGFVLYAKSPRGITTDQLAGICAGLPAGTRRVGVFVNEEPAEVARTVGRCGLYAAQIHGDEAAMGFASVSFPVWRAVRWSEATWRPHPRAWPAERYVVDSGGAGYGGTGVLADWGSAFELARHYRIMLAGGLNPTNVADAVRIVRPVGVDVSSGVEQAPGRKDAAKMREFVRRAREAAAT